MATYTIKGHPLNVNDLASTPGGAVDSNLVAALITKGVGQSVTITLSGNDDTRAKSHKAVE
jgi:hypothetical protein